MEVAGQSQGAVAKLSMVVNVRDLVFLNVLSRELAMYAVVEDGSKQYILKQGDVVRLDFRQVETGTTEELTNVLLLKNEATCRHEPRIGGGLEPSLVIHRCLQSFEAMDQSCIQHGHRSGIVGRRRHCSCRCQGVAHPT